MLKWERLKHVHTHTVTHMLRLAERLLEAAVVGLSCNVLAMSTRQRESNVIVSPGRQTAMPLIRRVNAAVETQVWLPYDLLFGSVTWRGSGSLFTLGWLTTASFCLVFSFFFLWLFSSFNWCFYHEGCTNPHFHKVIHITRLVFGLFVYFLRCWHQLTSNILCNR